MRQQWKLCVALIVLSTIVSCSSAMKDNKVTNGLSYEQAQHQTHDYARQSLKAFAGNVALTSMGSDIALPCSNSDDVPPSTPVSVQADYWVKGIDRSQLERAVDSFVSYWKAQGWALTLDRRPQVQYVGLTSKSGFDIVMQLTADGGRASVTATSPCVPPKQTGASSSAGG